MNFIAEILIFIILGGLLYAGIALTMRGLNMRQKAAISRHSIKSREGLQVLTMGIVVLLIAIGATFVFIIYK
jgi:hypothetical protein